MFKQLRGQRGVVQNRRSVPAKEGCNRTNIIINTTTTISNTTTTKTTTTAAVIDDKYVDDNIEEMKKRSSLRVVSPHPMDGQQQQQQQHHHYPLKPLRTASRLLENLRSRSSQSDLTQDSSNTPEEPVPETPSSSSTSTATTAATNSCLENVTVLSTDQGTEVMREAKTLHDLALHEYSMKRYDAALDCWAQALGHTDDTLQPIVLWNLVKLHLEMGATSEEHRRAAEMHFMNLRPELTRIALDQPTANVLEFLVEHKEWDASIRVAQKLEVDDEVLGRIYFEQSLTSDSPIRLLELCLQHNPTGKLRQDAYTALVEALSAVGNYERALELCREGFGFLKSKSDKANSYYKEAEMLAALGRTNEAMETVEKALELLPKSPSLLQAKADLLYLSGDLVESVKMYERVLTILKSPLQQAKILYTLGRIFHKTGQYSKAMSYYQRELKTTQKACGENHLECSRIYHEMAQLCDDACNYEKAIECCRNALRVERMHLQQASGHRRKELDALVRESQHRIGRIYYKKGDFQSALQSSFGDSSSSSSTSLS